jgi:hypothetical protein
VERLVRLKALRLDALAELVELELLDSRLLAPPPPWW